MKNSGVHSMKQTKQILVNMVTTVTALILTIAFQGCDELGVGNDFLKKPPSESVTKDTVFNSVEIAEQFLWHAYRSLPYYNGVVGGKIGRAHV